MNIFAKNIQILTRRHKAFIPVLKSNAYGLGLLPIARALETAQGAKMLAVAQVLEGAQLRQAGIRKEILVMGGTLPRQWSAAADLGLTLTVTRPGMVTELNNLGKQVNVHLKIETGLNRNGICPGEELAGVMEEFKHSCYVNLTGTYSHFAAAAARVLWPPRAETPTCSLPSSASRPRICTTSTKSSRPPRDRQMPAANLRISKINKTIERKVKNVPQSYA